MTVRRQQHYGVSPLGLAGTALAALATLRDPELDEPITALGFVASCTVSCEGPPCQAPPPHLLSASPNFAYLMVADASDAVTAVPASPPAEVSSKTTSPPTDHARHSRQAGFVACSTARR